MDLPPSVEKGKCNPKRKRPRCFGFELYFNDSICSIAGDFVFIEVVVVVVVVVPPVFGFWFGFGFLEWRGAARLRFISIKKA